MKAVLTTLADLPDLIRSEYEAQADGSFRLKVDGELPGYAKASDLVAANAKVVEFRDRNVSLLKEIAALSGVSEASDLTPLKAKLEKFADIDPEEHKTLKAKFGELEKKGVKGADDLDARLKAALDAAVNPLKQELAAEKEARTKAQQMIDQSTLRQAVAEKFLKVGGKGKALDYIVGQAAQMFRVDGGEVKAQPNRFSANVNRPGEPLTIDEWIASMMTEADFAFEPSQGGGSNGSPKGTTGGTRHGARQLVNPTPQQLGEHAKEIAEGKVQVVSQ